MKFQELKERYKNKFTMRMMAGILCIALAGGSFGVYQLAGEKMTAVDTELSDGQNHAAAKKAKNAKKADLKAGENAKADIKSDTESDESITSKLLSMFGKNKEAESGDENLDGKEETVYLISDANGNVNQTIVSSWLKNGSKNARIDDVSCLSEIQNVKGDESYTRIEEQITWQADGEDIYYRGTTTKQMPITQQITYYLDGNEISPHELAGKSGRVTIRFDYKNNAKIKADINGRKEEIYVPFTVVSGMVLNDSFRNVRVNNGRVLSDGNKIIAAGFAMPGLKESLGVKEEDFDEDFEFPEYVEVTADVEDFSLEMTMTAAVAGLMSDSGLSQNIDLSEVDDTMDEMTDAMGQLKDGGSRLADGLDTLHNNMGDFSSGVNTLKDGVNAYTDGTSRLAEGIQALSDNSGALETGVNTLNQSAKTISGGIQKLDQTLNTPMSEKEKAAAAKEAEQTAAAQFAKGSETYQTVYEAAVQNFQNTITGEATVNSVQAGIQSGLQAQGLTCEGVVAALAQYYAANGFTDASGKTYPAEVCQTNVPGTETTYAAYFANAVLNGGLASSLAGGITGGIAGQGAPAVGEAVVNACETAAKQAGAMAAVAGAEAAKKQAAAAIEAEDESSGYSLVSGAQALSAGTQQLADRVPALKNGIGQLLSGARELAGSNGALKDGVSKLADGTTQIRDGVVKLDDGAHELSDGLVEFDEKAVSKMAEAYHGDVKDLIERLKAAAEAGEDYGTLCGAAEGVSATTKFVFRTEAVKADEEE